MTRIDVKRHRLDRLTQGAAPVQQFTLGPFFPLGVVSILAAAGGVGKSLAALDLCIKVARRTLPGCPAYLAGPLGGMIPAEAGGASLFLTLEDSKAEIHRRRMSLDPHGNCAGSPCYVVSAVELESFDPAMVTQEQRSIALTKFATNELEKILDDIEVDSGWPVRLVVLDPAGDFIDADENDATGVKLLMRHLRGIASRRNCSILLLGHVAKTADGVMPTMRGSSAWSANSRAAYILWNPDNSEAVKLAAKVNFPAESLVFGCLSKGNHQGAPVNMRRLFRRDGAGRLLDITHLLHTKAKADSSALLTALVEAVAEAAAAGSPYAHYGAGGLYEQRDDLPPILSVLSKNALNDLGAKALEVGRLVKAKLTAAGAVKFLDSPDGALARGRLLPNNAGSRRAAIQEMNNKVH